MSVQRNYISRRNDGIKNAPALVFEPSVMAGRCADEGVKRVWPRPMFQIRN
jgi:hypothetical protein